MIRILFLSLFVISSVPALAQELYRYTDENGVEHIVDSPYKLPEGIREKYIKDYNKKKKNVLPPDLQDTRPAYRDVNKGQITEERGAQSGESEKEKDVSREEREKRLDELKRQLEETMKELGYKSQRALITQIPALKMEVEQLKNKVEEIKKEIERLSREDGQNPDGGSSK